MSRGQDQSIEVIVTSSTPARSRVSLSTANTSFDESRHSSPTMSEGLSELTSAPSEAENTTQAAVGRGKRARPAQPYYEQPKKKAKTSRETLHLPESATTGLTVRRIRSPSEVSDAPSAASSSAPTATKRAPARPKALVAPPTCTPLDTKQANMSDDQVLQTLHIREFLVRFATHLASTTITRTSESRSGITRETTVEVGYPAWLEGINSVCTFWDDEVNSCALLEALVVFAKKGNLVRSSGSVDKLLDECGEVVWHTKQAWRAWTTARDILEQEDILTGSERKEDEDEKMSSDLSDLDDESQDKKAKKVPTSRAAKLSDKLTVIGGMIDLLVGRSQIIRTDMAEGIETEKRARATMFKLRRQFTDDKASMNKEKPDGSPSKRKNWQNDLDEREAEYQLAMAENYIQLHSCRTRFVVPKSLDLEIFIPTPSIASASSSAANRDVSTSGLSLHFYGMKPTAPKDELVVKPVRKGKERAASSPKKGQDSTNGEATIKRWYSISSHQDIHTFASWLESQVKWRVYKRKLEAYEKAVKNPAHQEAPSAVKSAGEVEDKEILEIAHQVKAFAEFVETKNLDEPDVSDADEEVED